MAQWSHQGVPDTQVECRWGSECHQIQNAKHCAVFSHDKVVEQKKTESVSDHTALNNNHVQENPEALLDFLDREECTLDEYCSQWNDISHRVAKAHPKKSKSLPHCLDDPECQQYASDIKHRAQFQHQKKELKLLSSSAV
eukprot:TRINITY_DN24176_c0_g1_i1.p1 TRINITY_DN24176_c0_g1~~TRINITY_DN24176_c0_g1_i1.p1  ORF type:complete len:157 (-),score=28.06 TRINITY_DN24176_c0_g1_i1:50-469(-)